MSNIYDNKYFSNMSLEEIDKWIKHNYQLLIGSAVFTKNNSLTSKVVSWAEGWGKKEEAEFVPSHTGSIVEKDGTLYIFDMKPIKASIQPLNKYLYSTKDTFKLVFRTFKIDTFMFSQNMLYHVGEFYPFMSAIRSVFTKRKSKYRTHCSEKHLVELQKQNILTKVNPEITPYELYVLLTK